MKADVTKQTDGTIELAVTIPWDTVSKTYDTVVLQLAKTVQIPGFRQGTAPKKLVEEKLDKSKTFEEVLHQLLPTVYNDVIKEHSLRPVINPKIEFKEALEGKDWTLKIYTCEKPAITLGDYKKAIAEVKVSKAKKIWVPGQEVKDESKEKKDSTKPMLDEVLTAVLSAITIQIPSILIEQELNKMLSNLIDQVKKLGLTVEQYLASTNRTNESIRQEYTEQSRRTIMLEFALEEIADKEGILVSDDDVTAVIQSAKNEEEKKSMETQRYYLATILRRQKTLDFLSSL